MVRVTQLQVALIEFVVPMKVLTFERASKSGGVDPITTIVSPATDIDMLRTVCSQAVSATTYRTTWARIRDSYMM